MTEPIITYDAAKRAWRVDLPNGDYCYQPSADFAKAYARRWRPPAEIDDGMGGIYRPGVILTLD